MASSKRVQKKGHPAKSLKKPAKRKTAALRARADHKLSNDAARGSQSVARTVAYVTLPVNTVLATAETIVRCSRPFAELPFRAARARTPAEIWSVHARFVQDVVSEGLLATRRFWSLGA